MKEYVATFWTHFAAMSTLRALETAGIHAQARPVPRDVSASCGTCVFYLANDVCAALLHRDFETVYEQLGERDYQAVLCNDKAE
ncbi:MAG: DUF3343 domain-containing protein [Clostridia bacterium]